METNLEEYKKPYFCENKSDFHKMCLAAIKIWMAGIDDPEFLTLNLRVMFHEYLAMVLSGEIQPYAMPEEWVAEESDGFKSLMNSINETMIDIGFPIKEGEEGKVEIDYDAFNKIVEDMRNEEENE